MLSQGLKSLLAPVAGSIGGPKVAQEITLPAAVSKPTSDEQVPVENPSEAVRVAAKQIDTFLKGAGREVEFSVDEQTNITVVTVRQAATGEVIRQIPNEEVLRLARHLGIGSNVLLDLKI